LAAPILVDVEVCEDPQYPSLKVAAIETVKGLVRRKAVPKIDEKDSSANRSNRSLFDVPRLKSIGCESTSKGRTREKWVGEVGLDGFRWG
jgi:hypothetical protein